MVANDPTVGNEQASGDRQIAAAEGDFQSMLRRAFIDFGASDTSKLGEFAKYIDPATIEAAKANKFSQMAQNMKAQAKNLAQSRAALAASGMLRSGSTTTQTRDIQEARETGDFDALRGLLGGAETGTRNLASLRESISQKVAQAKIDAANRYAEQYPAQWVPGETASTPGAPAAAKPPAQMFGGVSGTRQLANGGSVTTYANGRQVQTNPNGTKYVIKAGG
jgi:hypothetical protein